MVFSVPSQRLLVELAGELQFRTFDRCDFVVHIVLCAAAVERFTLCIRQIESFGSPSMTSTFSFGTSAFFHRSARAWTR